MSTRDRSTWRSPALGEPRTLDLPGGRIRVHEAGTGAPIVLVHGLLVNANLWRKVVEHLAPDFRCLVLEVSTSLPTRSGRVVTATCQRALPVPGPHRPRGARRPSPSWPSTPGTPARRPRGCTRSATRP